MSTILDSIRIHHFGQPNSLNPDAKLDHVESAWVAPNGEVHPIGCGDHSWFADKLGKKYQEMLSDGYIRLSNRSWSETERGITQAQFDTMFAWHEAHGRTFDPADWPAIQ